MGEKKPHTDLNGLTLAIVHWLTISACYGISRDTYIRGIYLPYDTTMLREKSEGGEIEIQFPSSSDRGDCLKHIQYSPYCVQSWITLNKGYHFIISTTFDVAVREREQGLILYFKYTMLKQCS